MQHSTNQHPATPRHAPPHPSPPPLSSATNRILAANDFGSVQINVGKVDPVTGRWTRQSDSYGLCGFIRGHAEADESLWTLVKKASP